MIVTNDSVRDEFAIIDKRPPNVRYSSVLLDVDGRWWRTGWIQVRPDTLEAFAWPEEADAVARVLSGRPGRDAKTVVPSGQNCEGAA
ncbi:hypothetical protein AOB60_00010 [Streptomyces noursei]|uniref:Uncharacterized protein n=1 Tax=Streptomyces noursei TaxID=1971 RepID=A0A2N8PQT2_STRNR|nr:hypothetical protein AOB60_00010 [Streptomyces noursei]